MRPRFPPAIWPSWIPLRLPRRNLRARPNKEFRRRPSKMGVFPDSSAQLNLTGPVPIEQDNKSKTGDRPNFSPASMAQLEAMNVAIETVVVVNLIPALTGAKAESTYSHGY